MSYQLAKSKCHIESVRSQIDGMGTGVFTDAKSSTMNTTFSRYTPDSFMYGSTLTQELTSSRDVIDVTSSLRHSESEETLSEEYTHYHINVAERLKVK